MTLFPDQQTFIEDTRALLRARQLRILQVAATGYGKGTCCAYMVSRAVASGRRILFLVHGRDRIHDMSHRLDVLGIDHGIIMGNHTRRKPWLSTFMASISTIHRRAEVPSADLIFIDEAHLATGPTWGATLDRYPNVPVIGMTATPILGNGAGLSPLFTSIVRGPSVTGLIKAGRLVRTRVFAPDAPDRDIPLVGNEFNQKAMAAAFTKAKITGDLVRQFKSNAIDRKAVCFPWSVAGSLEVADSFRSAGVNAVHVDADTRDDDRARIWNDLDHGNLQVVCSVGVTVIGWDHPVVSCGIDASMTASLGRHLQKMGRPIRSHPGKQFAVWNDHAGNYHEHGDPELDPCGQPREWDLETGIRKKINDYDPALAMRTCRTCWLTYSSRLDKCPSCRAPFVPNPREVQRVEGELKEIAAAERKALAIEEWRERLSDDQKWLKYLEFVQTAKERGYKNTWPQVKFKVMFGSWPPSAWTKDLPTDYERPEWHAGVEAIKRTIDSRLARR